MCGIAGVIGSGAELERDLLSRMSDSLRHRGPDGEGLWLGDGAALAHRRLAILDLSSLGKQPMESPCGRFVISYNGEIYNYLELRRELAEAGVTFRSQSDTEVLLAWMAKEGVEGLRRLNGMWAFLLWDRERRSLLASRDRFGKKPLYYMRRGEQWCFASEMKALRQTPSVSWTVNDQAVADFAAERVTDHSPETFIREVQQVPAGGFLLLARGRVRTGRYYHLELAARGRGEAADPEGLRNLFLDSVRLRLRADTPVGCLLSGGVDSSAVAASMLRVPGAPPRCHAFTTLTDPPVEESQGVAHIVGSGERYVAITDMPSAEEFWTELPRLLWHQEQPFADGSMYSHYRLMRLARQHGVPVVLTGQGADEVFAGYPSHLWRFLAGRLRRGYLHPGSRGVVGSGMAGVRDWARVVGLSLPSRLRHEVRRRRLRAETDWLDLRPRRQVDALDERTSASTEPLDEYLRLCIEVRTLPGFLHYEDRNSMAFGVETRLPFLDHRLVELAFRLSPEARLGRGVTKLALRQAMTGIVPAPILERRAKTGYPAPLARWLSVLQPEVMDVLHSRVTRECPLIQRSRLCARAERFFRGDASQLAALWRGVILILWHEQFVRGVGPQRCA